MRKIKWSQALYSEENFIVISDNKIIDAHDYLQMDEFIIFIIMVLAYLLLAYKFVHFSLVC